MSGYICIHGHFYQPPRENPWLEDIELQDSAYPYHDWNQRITDECYRKNAEARILGPNNKIIDIVNNYMKMSFDFGPTLLRWLEVHATDVYEKILNADKKGIELYGGHGPAIAQPYNHMIMPLANRRDKITQVIWGIKDFQFRFKRDTEGMWLPETAVDIETLEILAQNKIKFTILSPHQANRFRKVGDRNWKNAEKQLDITFPYLCKLPSGAQITIFFYQGPISKQVAYGSLLNDGNLLASDILKVFQDDPEKNQLVSIATDGETFGHHHKNGDMALAYCLHHIETNNLAQITIYGQFLEKFPPQCEVQINENTSWSCPHGVERWKSNCSCAQDEHFSGKQQWRGPLREALDWLRDKTIDIYQDGSSKFFSDPWAARDNYIDIINNRDYKNVEKFLISFSGKEISDDDKVILLKLLELQRNAMLMFTSCGWFFDDISGIETVQVILYASRVIQLTKEISEIDLQNQFMDMLEKATSNYSIFNNGKGVYQKLVKTSNVDLYRVAAHAAISLVLEPHTDVSDIYCFSAILDRYHIYEGGIQKLVIGVTTIQSKITYEKCSIDFAFLYFGNQNLTGNVSLKMADNDFLNANQKISQAFNDGDIAEVIRLMNTSFKGSSYTLWHLFKDQQRKILHKLLSTTWSEIDSSFRQIYEYNFSVMKMMRNMNIPIPKALSTPAEYIINEDLRKEISAQNPNIEHIKTLSEVLTQLSLRIDQQAIKFEASNKINDMMKKFEDQPDACGMFTEIKKLIEIIVPLVGQLDLEVAQNIFFDINKKLYSMFKQKADSGNESAKEWLICFEELADELQIAPGQDRSKDVC